MTNRFEKLTTGVSLIYKKIQKIKKHKMNAMGLKGNQVMCLYYLNASPDGLAAADLCEICREDKAGISRTLSELEEIGLIRYEAPVSGKKYRSKAQLTEKAQEYTTAITDLIRGFEEECGAGISEEDRIIFYKVLNIISGNLDRICTRLDNGM